MGENIRALDHQVVSPVAELHGGPVRKRQLLLYLSGSIQKGRDDGRPSEAFWSDDDERRLIGGITSAVVQTLNPAKSKLRRSDFYANFGCDLHLVKLADAIIVDARTKKGLGVGAEMMFAEFLGTPVITICPRTSPYRQDYLPDVFGEDVTDWVHPFVYGLSDFIVDSVDEVATLINELGENGLERKRPQIGAAIDYYNRVREAFERTA